MDKNKIILIGVVAALVLGGVVYLNVSGGQQSVSVPEVKEQVTVTPLVTEAKSTVGKVVSVSLDVRNFSFSQKEIRVKKGDTVKIQLTRKEGFHDWVIDEFNARTKQLGAGQTDTVEFVADKTGTFEYYCSVGQHRALGLVGKLIVE